MKFSKIASAAAAIAAAGMMTVSASALLVPVKDKAEKLHQSVAANWLIVPFYDGVEPLDKGKPEGSIDGLDYSKVAKIAFTFSVAEEDRDFWDGGVGGAVVFSVNGGDLGSGDNKSDKYDTYNWVTQDFWGVNDEDLGLTASDEKTLQAEKVGDYTYKLTSNAFENPLANGDAEKIGLMQIALNDWSGTALCQVQIDACELLDVSGNVLITFDGKGAYTLAGGSSAPVADKTDNTAPSTSTPAATNVDTGVEGVAAVVGVAALAAGAVVLSRKRK